jgi:hypothetical protein
MYFSTKVKEKTMHTPDYNYNIRWKKKKGINETISGQTSFYPHCLMGAPGCKWAESSELINFMRQKY